MSALYADNKIFHFPEKLQALADGRLTTPLHVRLKPTNHCSHRCQYCCYRNPDLMVSACMAERDQLSRDKLLEIAGDLARMGVKAVTFSGGGEPLLHPNLGEAIEELRRGGVRVAVLTNGSRLEGPIADQLAEAATWVRVSMDAADRDRYAQTRGVLPEAFDTVCRNVRAFAGRPGRRCELGISYIVTRENAEQVESFLELAKGMGVGHVKVSPAVVGTTVQENSRYVAPVFERVREQLSAAQARLADASFAIVDRFYLPDAGLDGYEKGYTRCPFLECLTVIGADGTIYTCQDKAYAVGGAIGSVRERSFAEEWSRPETRRRMAAINPARDCRHHCVAHRKNLALLEFLDAERGHLEFV